MFPLITCMEELMMFMGRVDTLTPPFDDVTARTREENTEVENEGMA